MDIKQQLLNEYGKNLVFLLDFDDCIIGICKQHGRPDVVAYDNDKIVSKLIENGVIQKDAINLQDNQIRAYNDVCAPVFITTKLNKEPVNVISDTDPSDSNKRKTYH